MCNELNEYDLLRTTETYREPEPCSAATGFQHNHPRGACLLIR